MRLKSELELFEHLFALEKKLHSFEVRSNKNELLNLLSPHFFEFGSSGTEWSLKDILERLPTEDGKTRIESENFNAIQLSDNVVLVTYISKRISHELGQNFFLRSSIWRFNSGRWQMEFHQGTPIGVEK